jgi:hypothetical protein
MHPLIIRAIDIEDAIASAEYDVIRAKAGAYDLLMHRLQGVLWSARNQAPAAEPVEVKADGYQPLPEQAPAPEQTPDADPFAAPQPQPDAQGQPQPRRGGRRRLPRTFEEAQAQRQEDGTQPAAEPTADEGQPLTAEALGLTPEPQPEPAAQPLPLPVVEAPDLSAAPQSTDDVYGTEPAADPFAD